ncbi:MAG: hypothetical protein IPI12_13755 [Ignavibacteriales bacterium]|nr:hypothetical protein [Ignavibacteriales bacterium]
MSTADINLLNLWMEIGFRKEGDILLYFKKVDEKRRQEQFIVETRPLDGLGNWGKRN